ncbi:MAG TPA: hypothetical protein VGG56_00950 [Terracidiphilus sp.]|jgi:hypothetical protein
MQSADLERAQTYLRSFIGRTLSSIECDEFHMELVFEDDARFQTHSCWRFMHGNCLLYGHGDIGGQVSKDVFAGLIGLKVVSTSMSSCGDTDLRFGKDHSIQTISDTVQFETWDAHVEEGWVIFSSGSTTVFPPPARLAATDGEDQ